ncbi:MAG TPA: pilus assembly protein TadG-related protein [Blastocatellia bacterium]|nr:pilus assembly protein TadG-related protein [Blastocatellia bacterium]
MISLRQLRHREKGSILGMAAVSMTAILLAVGLAIDVGHWYLVGGELQNAADAAALAGASSLDSTEGGILTAVERAKATVNKYEFSGIDATIADANISFAASLSAFDDGTALDKDAAKLVPATIKFVKVTVPPKSIGVFFASIATASSTISLSRSAVAGQSVELNTVCNVAPFSVVEYNTGDAGTTYLNSPDCPNTKEFTRGCTYAVQLEPGNGVSPGNYQLLSFSGDRGGSELKTKMAIGTAGCVTSGAEVPVYSEPGEKTGPVKQGVNTRFDEYEGGLDAADYPPDTNVKEGITYDQYTKATSADASTFRAPTHTGVARRRVMVVPIIKASQFDSGRNVVTITKFGAFFLRDKIPTGGSSGNIVAEYIGDAIALGDGSYDPGGGAGFPGLTVAVLYR